MLQGLVSCEVRAKRLRDGKLYTGHVVLTQGPIVRVDILPLPDLLPTEQLEGVFLTEPDFLRFRGVVAATNGPATDIWLTSTSISVAVDREPRLPLNDVPCVLHGAGFAEEAHLIDASKSGIAFRCTQLFPAGADVEVVFDDLVPPVRFHGRIVRTEQPLQSKSAEHGLKITSIARLHQGRWAAYLQQMGSRLNRQRSA